MSIRRQMEHALRDLRDAEASIERARRAVIDEIRRRLDEEGMTPSTLSRATGINKGNLYNMLTLGKWNQHIAEACAEVLDRPEGA